MSERKTEEDVVNPVTIPTVEQLAEALGNVRCYYDFGPELIAPELHKNLLTLMGVAGDNNPSSARLYVLEVGIHGTGVSG